MPSSRAVIAALALLLTACRDRGEPPADAAPAEPPFQGLTLDLTPDPEGGEIGVEVHVAGDRAARVRELAVARVWADTRGAEAILGPHARDADGEIQLVPRTDEGGPDIVYALARPARGELVVRHRAAASLGRSRFALRIAQDRMSGVGHAFLLLPRIEEPTPSRIRVHLGRLRRGADAASSFGFGADVTTTATSEELAHAVYVAGMLWREPGPNGNELVVLGDPPFDTRAALDHGLAARAAVDQFFRAPSGAPLHVVLIAQPGLGPAREGAYLTRSLALWFDTRQVLDASLDLVVAHEFVHRFIGGAVRLVGEDGREATWFSEGFTMHAARRAMLEAGLLASQDLAADVNRTLGAFGDADAVRVPDEYRRGALLAAALDVASRRPRKGARSLDDALRDLAGRGGTLPVSALKDAVGPEIAAEVAPVFAQVEAREEPTLELPEDAFGPCLRRRVRERASFGLGFDRRSLDGTPAIIRGLQPGSLAERAGVRDGALVLRYRLPAEGDVRGEVELVFADGKRVRYAPTETKRTAVWEPSDDTARCAIVPVTGRGR
jgi:hypothetical protein